MTYKLAARLIERQFPDHKIINAYDCPESYVVAIVPRNAQGYRHNGKLHYDVYQNVRAVNKQTGKISEVSTAPDSFPELMKNAKLIYKENI